MKKVFKVMSLGLIALGLLVVIIAIASPGSRKPTASPADPLSTVVTGSTSRTVQPAGPVSEFGNGTYEVGTDIKPGKYKTAGPAQDDYMKMCYWSRSKNSSGDFGSIITNGTTQGPDVVTTNKGEILKASGSCTWKLSP